MFLIASKSTHRYRRAAALAVLLLTIAVIGGRSEVLAADVPVTVTITRFIEIDDPDPIQGDGDYYARVTIDGFPAQQSGEVTGEDIRPFWTFSRLVSDAGGPTVPIVIQIFDADVFPAEPDDVIDLNPLDAVTDLQLVLDLATGDWTGPTIPGFATNQSSSVGDGDTEYGGITEGGERGRVFFTISTVSTNGDADGDGLLDGWESKGLDFDGDGSIDVDLPAFGADPLHKDLFLEFDWVNGQEPTRAAIQTLKAAYALAPTDAGGVSNPDGTPGINLWVDTGSLTDPTASEDGGAPGSCGDGIDNGPDGATDAADPDCLVGDNLGGGNGVAGPVGCLDAAFYVTKAGNFAGVRQWVFRYGVSGDPADNTPCNGGRGEIGGNDFVEYNHDAGTIMHEHGHNLNLRHGGNVNGNCKPVYVSVMNYDLQFGIPQAGGTSIIDYSRSALPTINEGSLSEQAILDATDTTNRMVFVNGNGQKTQAALNAGVDWDGDGTIEAGTVSVNVDTSDATSGRPSACTNGSSNSNLGGYDDWDVVALGFRQFGDSANGAINPELDPVPTLQDLLISQQDINTTDVSISMVDSDDPAVAGEELTYTVTIENLGPNPSSDTQLTDVLPTGVSHVSDDAGCVEGPAGTLTCDLGELLAGASRTVHVTVLIAADLVYNAGGPLTITNNASVANLAGPDPNEANNDATEDTEVRAEADLEIVSMEITGVDGLAPGLVLVGEDVEVVIHKTIRNNGPSAPMDVDLDLAATAPADSTVLPAMDLIEEDALALDEERDVEEHFTIRCDGASHHTFTFSNTISPRSAEDTDPDLSNNDAEVVLEVTCVVPVTVNLHPHSDPNSVNLNSTVPLAVLTTGAGEYGNPLAFDATTIDPASVRFGPSDVVLSGAGATPRHNGHIQDSWELDESTRDHDPDMLLHFFAADSGLEVGDTEGCVIGEWVDGNGDVHLFYGCDVMRVVS